MIICDLDKCTGCMLCYNLCPVNAITIKGDRYGFSIPEIDSVKCIKCNICKSKCPQNNDKNKFLMSKDVYAMWSKDTNLRMDSTSGGVFSGLAEAVIKAGGCVYGAAFDETFRVLHQRVDSLEGGSMYLEVQNMYKAILAILIGRSKKTYNLINGYCSLAHHVR